MCSALFGAVSVGVAAERILRRNQGPEEPSAAIRPAFLVLIRHALRPAAD
jgi:hypothetical protein